MLWISAYERWLPQNSDPGHPCIDTLSVLVEDTNPHLMDCPVQWCGTDSALPVQGNRHFLESVSHYSTDDCLKQVCDLIISARVSRQPTGGTPRSSGTKQLIRGLPAPGIKANRAALVQSPAESSLLSEW